MMTNRHIVLLLLSVLVMAGCRAVPEPSASHPLETTYEDSDAPTLTVESLDNSIPLGDSFPIAINITNAASNETMTLELIGGGITPSFTETTVTTDSLGNAEVRLSARASKPKLDTLDVIGYGEENLLTSTLYVNYEDPYIEETELTAQNGPVVGEPVTIDEYYATLPIATNVEEIEAFEQNPNPPEAYVLDGVRFENEDGSLEEPINAVVFSTGSQVIENQFYATQSCTTETTYITLKTAINGTP